MDLRGAMSHVEDDLPELRAGHHGSELVESRLGFVQLALAHPEIGHASHWASR
jgi:hypothetical protein